MGLELRSPRDIDELRAIWDMLTDAFGWDGSRFERFADGAKLERILAAFVDDEPVACSRVREFGQFFGGRRVAMGGYSPVGVAAAHRGRGYGTLITTAQYEPMRERGEVLAGLYPATTALYRRAGFELAGVWATHKVRTRELQRVPQAAGVTARRATDDDWPAIEACYARIARDVPGFLDRYDIWWTRLRGTEHQQVYVVDGNGGEIAGYVRYQLNWRDGSHVANLHVAELITDEPDVAHALWRVVGSSSSIAPETTVTAPNESALLLSIQEQEDFVQAYEWRWMARVVDLRGAITARGYPPGLRASVDLRVIDPHCEWNDGQWRLVVEDREATVERGGDGEIELGIGALSALYTGYMTPAQLAGMGKLRGGGHGERAALAAVFAGPTPWTPDFY
jgi:predicted acetyltransferase